MIACHFHHAFPGWASATVLVLLSLVMLILLVMAYEMLRELRRG